MIDIFWQMCHSPQYSHYEKVLQFCLHSNNLISFGYVVDQIYVYNNCNFCSCYYCVVHFMTPAVHIDFDITDTTLPAQTLPNYLPIIGSADFSRFLIHWFRINCKIRARSIALKNYGSGAEIYFTFSPSWPFSLDILYFICLLHDPLSQTTWRFVTSWLTFVKSNLIQSNKWHSLVMFYDTK